MEGNQVPSFLSSPSVPFRPSPLSVVCVSFVEVTYVRTYIPCILLYVPFAVLFVLPLLLSPSRTSVTTDDLVYLSLVLAKNRQGRSPCDLPGGSECAECRWVQ